MASGPGYGFSIDTSRAAALARGYKLQAARVHVAIKAANTELANEMQVAEARELAKQVAAHGRPQGNPRGRGNRLPLGQALRSDQNRRVSSEGFTVNDESFLDSTAMYWRQLEEGAQGRTQILRGLFLERGRLVRPGGSRSAGRFIQYGTRRGQRGASEIQALIGPADPYRYIERATKRVSDRWRSTKRPLNVYRRAFAAQGLDLMAQFQSTHGGRLRGAADLGE